MALNVIPFRFPGIDGVTCAFFTRAAGNISLDLAGMAASNDVAQTLEHRKNLSSRLGVEAFAEVHQVHGVDTGFEPAPQDPGRVPGFEADGMATHRAQLALMIKTADCQPILLAHASGQYVAALHAGWRGNRQNYPGRAVAEFCAHYNIRPEDLSAVRGPSLGPAAAEFVHFDKEWGQEFAPWFNHAAHTMDLWRLTRDQLQNAGLRPERIYGLDLCTWSLPETFFSYRRFCKTHYTVADGRQGSFIWRE